MTTHLTKIWWDVDNHKLVEQAIPEDMTKDDDDTLCYRSELEKAVQDEREACAALLEANAMACENPIHRSLLQANADEIRARGRP